eukprot:jgi/Antlo1/637/2492
MQCVLSSGITHLTIGIWRIDVAPYGHTMEMNIKQQRTLAEILDSERIYVQDLWFWGVRFKEALVSWPNMHYLRKQKLGEKIFINMSTIFELHKSIHKDLVMHNKEFIQKGLVHSLDGEASARDIEYHAAFYRLLEGIHVYETYVFGLPMSRHVIGKESETNPEFKEFVDYFLRKYKVENLGVDHFILRPIQKLARYPLLLSSLVKHERNTEYRDKVLGFVSKLDAAVKNVDRRHQKAKNFFRIFEISKCLKRGNHMINNMGLNLFSKKRVLYKEGEAIVCTKHLRPDIRSVMVFDSMILICDAVVEGEKESLYLQDVLVPHKYLVLSENADMLKHESVRNKCPMHLVDKFDRDNVVEFYFENRVVKNIWEEIIVRVIAKVEKGFDKCISIVKVEDITTEQLQCMCMCVTSPTEVAKESSFRSVLDTESNTSSVRSDEKDRQVVEKQETPGKILAHNSFINVSFSHESLDEIENVERKFSIFKWIFGFAASVKNVTIERVEALEDDKFLRLYSTSSGIYKQQKQMHVRVHTFGRVTKLVYDANLGIVIFQNMGRVYISAFNSGTIYLNPCILVENAQSFFYSTYSKKNYTAVIELQNSSSHIYLFEIVVYDTAIRFLFTRKLYMGSQVYDIKSFGMNIVVASKDFEIVDPDSSMTQELIPSYHFILPYYFFLCKDYHAKTILPANTGCYIVCFSNLAFVINSDLSPNSSNIVFTWHNEPTDFRVSGDYFIVLGIACISIFYINTGKLVFFESTKTLHFLDSKKGPLLYDTKSIYSIKHPNARQPESPADKHFSKD